MLIPQFLADSGQAIWFTSDTNTAFNILIIFRVIGGIGIGITSVVAPVYISELTLPENRGRFVSIYQLSITLGILLDFLIDWIVLNQAGDAAGVIAKESSGFLNWIFIEELIRNEHNWRKQLGSLRMSSLFLFSTISASGTLFP